MNTNITDCSCQEFHGCRWIRGRTLNIDNSSNWALQVPCCHLCSPSVKWPWVRHACLNHKDYSFPKIQASWNFKLVLTEKEHSTQSTICSLGNAVVRGLMLNLSTNIKIILAYCHPHLALPTLHKSKAYNNAAFMKCRCKSGKRHSVTAYSAVHRGHGALRINISSTLCITCFRWLYTLLDNSLITCFYITRRGLRKTTSSSIGDNCGTRKARTNTVCKSARLNRSILARKRRKEKKETSRS